VKLLECEAKAVLKSHGLTVPAGAIINAPQDIEPALSGLGLSGGVLKAQVFTGGRGKAGGVKLFEGAAEGKEIAQKLLGMTLVTHQTGPVGEKVGKLYLEPKCTIARELYCAILLDREANNPVLILSAEGGMEIEDLAENHPEKLLRMHLPIGHELWAFQANQALAFLGISGETGKELLAVINGLWKVYQAADCSMLEINPLVIDKDGHVIILDCKMIIDDNAVFRRAALGNPDADKTPAEVEAAKWGLSYIPLDGSVGCMVNGAGLAMATLDLIVQAGLQPANFLDVGGSANEEAVTHAFEIILSDPKVKVILVNIFGGIMKCDIIALGVIAATKKLAPKVPIVVRLQGTNVELGQKLLAESGLTLISADDLVDAANKLAKAAKEGAR
jgi:succinyl-CoA synthetase beta subunit